MKFKLKITESDSFIKKNVLELLSQQIFTVFKKSAPKIESKIKILIKQALIQQPEYLSLTSGTGELRLNFGIFDKATVDGAISDFIEASTVNINPVKAGNIGVNGGLVFKFIPATAVSDAAEKYAIITEKGQALPWLSWLLYEGTSPIIKNYEIRLGPNPFSRTSGAIMVSSKKNWRVPPTFAGTVTNNWITRAIENLDNDIFKIIEDAIKDNI